MDGVLYISGTPPRCPRHGQMHYRSGSCQGYTAGEWVCHGFDGEGCDHTAQLEWTSWMPVPVSRSVLRRRRV